MKLFLSEDSPSQVGLNTQDHLQAKTLWQAHAGGMGPDDNLPPGFEGIQPANPWTVKLSQIPLMKWKCPPRVCSVNLMLFCFFKLSRCKFFKVFSSCFPNAVSVLVGFLRRLGLSNPYRLSFYFFVSPFLHFIWG